MQIGVTMNSVSFIKISLMFQEQYVTEPSNIDIKTINVLLLALDGSLEMASRTKKLLQ
jgi:hypothetical protein